MIVRAPVSPVKKAYTKAAFKAGQPWFSVGLLLLGVSIIASAATGDNWIAPSFRYPSVGLELVGLAIEAYGVSRIARWKKANPLNQFDRGARS
jgi:hypothetical protein